MKNLNLLNITLGSFSLFGELFVGISILLLLVLVSLLRHCFNFNSNRFDFKKGSASFPATRSFEKFQKGFLLQLQKPLCLSMSFIFFASCYLIYNDDVLHCNSVAFNNTFINSELTFFSKLTVCFFAGIFFIVISDYEYDQKLTSFEYFLILLAAILGLILLCSSNNLLISYIAIELISLASYALAVFRKDSVYSVESGLKYFIVGSVSSTFFLLDIGFIYACSGALYFPDLWSLFSLYFEYQNPCFIQDLTAFKDPAMGLNKFEDLAKGPAKIFEDKEPHLVYFDIVTDLLREMAHVVNCYTPDIDRVLNLIMGEIEEEQSSGDLESEDVFVLAALNKIWKDAYGLNWKNYLILDLLQGYKPFCPCLSTPALDEACGGPAASFAFFTLQLNIALGDVLQYYGNDCQQIINKIVAAIYVETVLDPSLSVNFIVFTFWENVYGVNSNPFLLSDLLETIRPDPQFYSLLLDSTKFSKANYEESYSASKPYFYSVCTWTTAWLSRYNFLYQFIIDMFTSVGCEEASLAEIERWKETYGLNWRAFLASYLIQNFDAEFLENGAQTVWLCCSDEIDAHLFPRILEIHKRTLELLAFMDPQNDEILSELKAHFYASNFFFNFINV